MKLFALAMCLALTFLVTGCSKIGTSSAPPNTLRIGVQITPNSLNPILASNTIETFIDGLFSSELVTLNDHGKEVPDLATTVPSLKNGGISHDGLRITYHLRKNARWQDGVPVTSHDVAFTWRAIMNNANNVVSHTGYDQVDRVRTPDAHTVVFVLKRPFAPFVQTVFSESDSPMRILPAHLLASKPNLNHIKFNSKPIGSGPYQVVRWIRGDRIELVANAAYYRGKPKIPKIIIRIIPNASTLEAETRAGNIDIAHEISTTTAHDLSSDADVRILHVEAPEYFGIAFNTTHPVLRHRSVRRALALAIDSHALIAKFFHGYGTQARADLSPFSWGYDPSLPRRPFDPALAGRLLDAAGWHMGADGIRRKGTTPLDFVFVYGQGSTAAQDLVVTVASMLRAIGVKTELKSYDYSLPYATIQENGILNGGKFDLAYYAWVSGSDPDNSSAFRCDAIPPAGNNVWRYCSPEIDKAENAALATYSHALRKRAYAKIEALLMQDVPLDFFAYPGLTYALTRRVHGFAPNGVSEGWNAQDWSLSP